MVSNEKIITIGYVYGILGTLGFFVLTIWTAIQSVLYLTGTKSFGDVYEIILMPFHWISLAFFVMLLVGIHKKKITLVKIHRVYLRIASLVVLECVTIESYLYIYDPVFPERNTMTVIVLISYLIGFFVSIVQYLLFQWIVNSVVAAIQNEQEFNDPALCQPEIDCKQRISSYAPA